MLEKTVIPFSVKALDFEEGTFEGYAAAFNNADAGEDIIEPGAFAKTINENLKRIKICWQHDGSEPIGKPVELREDERGLYLKGKISRTARGADALTLMRDGVVTELSIGYDAIKHQIDGKFRRLKEIRLWEISPVTWAMNPKAQILAVKSALPFAGLPIAEPETVWDGAAAEKRIREFAGGPDNVDWVKYRKGFLLVDPENSENFTGYKIPIADVIDGELKAIPAGIFAAAGALQGAQGGVDIDPTDADRAKMVLVKYFGNPWGASKAEDAPDEMKAGRVLSKNNMELLKAAVDALSALLSAAERVELADPAESEDGEAAGKGQDAPEEIKEAAEIGTSEDQSEDYLKILADMQETKNRLQGRL